MNEFDIRLDEISQLYKAIGEVLGEQAREKMSYWCLARVLQLHTMKEIQDEFMVLHNSN